MALEDSPSRKRETLEKTLSIQGFDRVFRTTGRKPATVRETRAEKLINTDQEPGDEDRK